MCPQNYKLDKNIEKDPFGGFDAKRCYCDEDCYSIERIHLIIEPDQLVFYTSDKT